MVESVFGVWPIEISGCIGGGRDEPPLFAIIVIIQMYILEIENFLQSSLVALNLQRTKVNLETGECLSGSPLELGFTGPVGWGRDQSLMSNKGPHVPLHLGSTVYF